MSCVITSVVTKILHGFITQKWLSLWYEIRFITQKWNLFLNSIIFQHIQLHLLSAEDKHDGLSTSMCSLASHHSHAPGAFSARHSRQNSSSSLLDYNSDHLVNPGKLFTVLKYCTTVHCDSRKRKISVFECKTVVTTFFWYIYMKLHQFCTPPSYFVKCYQHSVSSKLKTALHFIVSCLNVLYVRI